ncbi:MAG: cellulase family glycosylhydrolase [Clostridia bacterium]|nr:cellulase family glycosylhydrolase [Clostridia bacterium]
MNTLAVDGRRIIDNFGRERIFNGLNFVYKGCEPDEDGVIRYKSDITDELLKKLTAKGINIIRLGMTWAGIEPNPCEYNNAYLDGVKEILALCEKNNMYVFLDWHQDLYSPFDTHYGDGAPLWACTDAHKVKKIRLIWAEGYFFNKGVQHSFDKFWDNEPYRGRGLQDRFCDMLKYTISYLGDYECVIGYDVFNEPYPGSSGGKTFRRIVGGVIKTLLFHERVDRKKLVSDALSRDVMAMLSCVDDEKVYKNIINEGNKYIYKFDTEKFYPFMKRCSIAIRQVTKKGLIFMENCYYSNTGIPCSTPRVTYEDGTKEADLVFSPHGYDLTVDTPLTNEASPYRIDHIFNEHERTQARLDCPVLVGEWGGMVPGGERYPALQHLVDKFDRNRWSQTYWHYFGGFEDSKIMDIISRPLPQAVAGTIKKYEHDKKANTFVLSYTGSSTIKSPTVIYLPQKPQAVYSTKKYTLKEIGNAYLLQVSAGKGECVVKVEF